MVPEIDGNTGIFVQLAHPSGFVRTPQMLNQAFVDRGIDVAAVTIDVTAEDLPDLLHGLRGWRNLVGAGVTMPHKGPIIDLLDEVEGPAREIGSVNMVRRDPDGHFVGTNGDGRGFVLGLRNETMNPTGSSVMVVGVGGAGRSISWALAHAGVERLALSNRTKQTAERLAEELSTHFEGLDVVAVDAPDPTGYDLVINATPLGMHADDALPILVDRLDPATTIADIIMAPSVTCLMEEAERRGCPVHAGRSMMTSQTEIFMEFLRLEELYGSSSRR